MVLLAGLWFPPLGKTGAGGLALMMFLAVLVRIRIRDTLLQTVPAIIYLFLNTYLFLRAYQAP
jgi:hypothetical protein